MAGTFAISIKTKRWIAASYLGLFLVILVGCQRVTPPKNLAPTNRATDPVSPPSGSAVVRPLPIGREIIELFQAELKTPRTTQVLEIEGGITLLHVMMYRDHENGKDDRRASLTNAAWEPGEPFREVLTSFVLGPLPMATSPIFSKTASSASHKIRVMLARDGNFIQLVSEQRTYFDGDDAKESSRRFESRTALQPDYENWDAVGKRIRMKDFLASQQFPQPVERLFSRATSELKQPVTLPPGQRTRVYWDFDGGTQVVVVAECLPFGPSPDEAQLNASISQLKEKIAKASSDQTSEIRLARYHLAWAINLLSQVSKESADQSDRPQRLEGVEILRKLAAEEPANIFFRDSLRSQLGTLLRYERFDLAQTTAIVDEFLALHPVFEECLDIATGLTDARELPVKSLTSLTEKLVRTGLESGKSNPQQQARFIARVKRLTQYIYLNERVLEEFEKSSTTKP